ncbi:MAG: acetate--CoA ligase family protein, partial [Candidatus Nanoarchaeia archaeon]|nr:acetate--CoA ligase family protein [Candidatus Nanoarchaeia archaeon]
MKVFVEREAEDFLEENGFPVAKRAVAENAEKAKLYAKKLGYPITMKVISQSILHKSDVGGVKLDIRNPHEVEKAFFELKKLKGFKGVLMQSYKEGNFVLIGLKEDPVFGHALAFGTGGIYT